MKTTDQKKFIVITSIFPPTEAVEKFAALSDWQLVVVGDKKTPQGWSYPGVIYLSPEDQEKLGVPFIAALPWNSYARKMAGYAYAVREGADILVDTDDDNIPYENWDSHPAFSGKQKVVSGPDFVNMYSEFTKEFIWPRGFPLNRILTPEPVKKLSRQVDVGVWQFLADEDPDVDAIYRLTNNTPVFFDQKKTPLVLEKGTVCPFNSQNTVFKKSVFPLLFLPAFVTFRFTDILRGLVAQPLLWSQDLHLGFGTASVIQKRNPHNYLKDFESEIPCYLHPETVIATAQSAIIEGASLEQNLLSVYTALEKKNLVSQPEIELLQLWLQMFR